MLQGRVVWLPTLLIVTLILVNSCSPETIGTVANVPTVEQATAATSLRRATSTPTREATAVALPHEAASTPTAEPTVAATSPWLVFPPPRCDDSTLILPESMVTSAQRIDWEEFDRRASQRTSSQMDWLSLRLDLDEHSFDYGAAIPFRLTFTNETDHPVIFYRPQSMALEPPLPSDLLIVLVDSSGERVVPPPLGFSWEPGELPPAGREAFSVLSPLSSCVVNLELRWDETWPPLAEPLPPGDYEMRAVYYAYLAGPVFSLMGPEGYSGGIYDVGAWMTGSTQSSNNVIFTILPPERP